MGTLQRTSNLSFSGYIRGEIRFIKKTYDLLTNSWINPWMKMSSYAEEYVIYIYKHGQTVLKTATKRRTEKSGRQTDW